MIQTYTAIGLQYFSKSLNALQKDKTKQKNKNINPNQGRLSGRSIE